MTRFLILILLLLITGCVSPDVGPPPVDLDRLAPLVAELQLAEAIQTEVPVIIRDSIKQVYYQRVLEDHKMSEATFDSLTWIIRQEPTWVDSLYTKVGDILAKLQTDRAE